MDDTLETTLEIDGAITPVIVEYAWYMAGPQVDAVMDLDGEPVEPTDHQVEQLRRQITQKHNRRVAV